MANSAPAPCQSQSNRNLTNAREAWPSASRSSNSSDLTAAARARLRNQLTHKGRAQADGDERTAVRQAGVGEGVGGVGRDRLLEQHRALPRASPVRWLSSTGRAGRAGGLGARRRARREAPPLSAISRSRGSP